LRFGYPGTKGSCSLFATLSELRDQLIEIDPRVAKAQPWALIRNTFGVLQIIILEIKIKLIHYLGLNS
jgi:hypothetical protein